METKQYANRDIMGLDRQGDPYQYGLGYNRYISTPEDDE